MPAIISIGFTSDELHDVKVSNKSKYRFYVIYFPLYGGAFVDSFVDSLYQKLFYVSSQSGVILC